MHLAALSQSAGGISCQKSSRSWFQFKWSLWTRESYIPPSLSISLCVYIYTSRSSLRLSRVQFILWLCIHACLRLCVSTWHGCWWRVRWSRVNWRFRLSSYCCLVSIKFQLNGNHWMDLSFEYGNFKGIERKQKTRKKEKVIWRIVIVRNLGTNKFMNDSF